MSWLYLHACKLINHVTGRGINYLVNIDRGKPYFDWDELSSDQAFLEHDGAVALDDTHIDMPEPKEVVLPWKTMPT